MTQIKCCYCQTSYEIDDALISEKVKKLRCAKCKEIFEFHKTSNEVIVKAVDQKPKENNIPTEEDTNNKENASEEITKENAEEKQASDISVTAEIFARLNSSLDVCKEDNANKTKNKKQTIAELIGWTTKNNKKAYIVFITVITLLLINYFKFEITRVLPFMANIYGSLGIKSTINGEGLEFLNVKKETFSKENKEYMEVKGYLRNKTERTIEIPTIIINLLDNNGNNLYSQKAPAPKKEIEKQNRIPFKIEIKNPNKKAKYIYLTFEE